jgi:hypothetical protein
MERSETMLDDHLHLVGESWVDTIKEIFERLLVVNVGEINKLLHLLLELVAQEPIVDPGDPPNIYLRDKSACHFFCLETGTEQVHAGQIPFLIPSGFLKSDVSAGFELTELPRDAPCSAFVNQGFEFGIDFAEVLKFLDFVLHHGSVFPGVFRLLQFT